MKVWVPLSLRIICACIPLLWFVSVRKPFVYEVTYFDIILLLSIISTV